MKMIPTAEKKKEKPLPQTSHLMLTIMNAYWKWIEQLYWIDVVKCFCCGNKKNNTCRHSKPIKFEALSFLIFLIWMQIENFPRNLLTEWLGCFVWYLNKFSYFKGATLVHCSSTPQHSIWFLLPYHSKTPSLSWGLLPFFICMFSGKRVLKYIGWERIMEKLL